MKDALIFVAGAAIGSLVTWKLIEKKYKDIADEEIESVKEAFKINKDNNSDKSEDNKIHIDVETISGKATIAEPEQKLQAVKFKDEDLVDYSNTVNTLEYKSNNQEQPIKKANKNWPYIISYDEFGTLDDWDTESWVYYADNVLTNNDDEIVVDYEHIIGDEALVSFDDTGRVYVRNDQRHCDYEILNSEKAFDE